MIYFIIEDSHFGSHVEQISTDFNKLRENFPNKPYDGTEITNCYRNNFYECDEDLPEELDPDEYMCTFYRTYTKGYLTETWHKDGWV